MQTFVVLLLFVGALVVLNGLYEERIRVMRDTVRVEYRFIPRTLYEEQLAEADVSGKFKNMFEKESPWSFDYDVRQK